MVILVVLTYYANPDGIPGLGIRQSLIPGLKIQVRDCNPYEDMTNAAVSKDESRSELRYLFIEPAYVLD